MILEKIAFLTAVLGTAALLFLSYTLEPPLIAVADIQRTMINDHVKVQGTIAEIQHKDTLDLIGLREQNATITVVSYRGGMQLRNAGIQEGIRIEVKGKVKEYYGRLEIEAEELRILS